MAALMYDLLAFTALFSVGLYHLISAARHHLKSPPSSYSAKPFHPLSSHRPYIKHLPLYFLLISLAIAALHRAVSSFSADPLLKGSTPVHRLTSLQSSAVLLLFLLLALSLLVSDSFPVPPDLFFALSAAAFFLQYSTSAASAGFQISDLEAKCDSTSALISAVSSLLCVALAVNPKLYAADLGLGASVCLQGLWILQSGLSLTVDAFIPDGCHKLLDVAAGLEGSTKCDLEDYKFRALAILDALFVLHIIFVAIIVMTTYAAIARSVGSKRLGGPYEPLPANLDSNHVQMKSLTGTQA